MGIGASFNGQQNVPYDQLKEFFGPLVINDETFIPDNVEENNISIDHLKLYLEQRTDVFLSCDWGIVKGVNNQKKVSEINSLLKQ